MENMLQVWTYKGRVAFVLSVLEKNKPIADHVKLQRLSQIMLDIMGGDLGIVTMDQVCLCFLSGPCRSFSHCLARAPAIARQWEKDNSEMAWSEQAYQC